MSSKRTLIIAAVAARLGEIQVENDFNTDAGLSVLFGDGPVFGPDDPPAVLSIVVETDQPGRHQGENVTAMFGFEVQAIVKVDIQHPTLAMEAMVEDVKRAIETEDRSFDGLAVRNSLKRGQTRVIDRPAGGEYCGLGVQYQCVVAEEWGNP